MESETVEDGVLGGRYLYCIIDSGILYNFSRIGIEEEEDVYTIPYMDIGVVVHDCKPAAYESKDEKVIIDYVQKHNNVVDVVFNKFGCVVPLRFNTIIKEKACNSNGAIEKWLAEQYTDLKIKLNEVQGKEEYGIQVFLDRGWCIKEILSKNERIIKLKEKIETPQSSGHAYLHKQMVEKAIGKELEEMSSRLAREVYSLIKKYSTDTRLEKTKKVDEKKIMLLNVPCLVERGNVRGFREELEKLSINSIYIRITGPWAPYSFV